MNPQKTTNWALILIAVALVGAGISYHFTLESRFAAIETKLEQNSIALQQYQITQETAISSKTEALTNLSKEVDTLQSSLEPLGKATREQTNSLSDIRKEISTLQQSQQAQLDAQKKLSDYASQLEKIKHDIQIQATAPAPSPTVSTTPASAAVAPLPTAHASAAPVLLPLPPRAESAVDIRPDDSPSVALDTSNRALPVALPVSLSATDAR